MPRTIRQAIPLDEIAANMQNRPSSVCKNKYSRKSTFISEAEAESRIVAVVGLFGGMAIIAIVLAIASVVYISKTHPHEYAVNEYPTAVQPHG